MLSSNASGAASALAKVFGASAVAALATALLMALGSTAAAPFVHAPVSVLDQETDALVVKITGYLDAPAKVAISPDGKRLYVWVDHGPHGHGSGPIAVINTATNMVVAAIPVQGGGGWGDSNRPGWETCVLRNVRSKCWRS